MSPFFTVFFLGERPLTTWPKTSEFSCFTGAFQKKFKSQCMYDTQELLEEKEKLSSIFPFIFKMEMLAGNQALGFEAM